MDGEILRLTIETLVLAGQSATNGMDAQAREAKGETLHKGVIGKEAYPEMHPMAWAINQELNKSRCGGGFSSLHYSILLFFLHIHNEIPKHNINMSVHPVICFARLFEPSSTISSSPSRLWTSSSTHRHITNSLKAIPPSQAYPLGPPHSPRTPSLPPTSQVSTRGHRDETLFQLLAFSTDHATETAEKHLPSPP